MKTANSLIQWARNYHVSDVAISCGVFDGVHRGHQRILSRLKELAAREAATPVVVTFNPHPQAVLQPEQKPAYLTNTDQQLDLFRSLGIHAAVILPFDKQMAAMSAREFLFHELLPAPVNVKAVCVGENWRFGSAEHGGDLNYLQRCGEQYGFDVEGVPVLHWYGKPISSTRIRRAISAARMRHAWRMLSRPHKIRGKVTVGQRQGGRKLGYPTANIVEHDILFPPPGVYAARGHVCTDGSPQAERPVHDAVAYVGTAPTLRGQTGQEHSANPLEVHFFNYSENLYGQELDVEIWQRIRKQQEFNSISALREQIGKDIAEARHILGS